MKWTSLFLSPLPLTKSRFKNSNPSNCEEDTETEMEDVATEKTAANDSGCAEMEQGDTEAVLPQDGETVAL